MSVFFKFHFKDEKHEFSNPLYSFDDIDVEFFVMNKEEIHFDYVYVYPCEEYFKFKKRNNTYYFFFSTIKV